MRKHLILLCTAAFLSSLHITAQSFRNEIDAKPELSASNCLAYPTPSGKLTPPPTGYVPVHISHYGRHGSRYLLSDNDYLRPLRTLERADSAGVLTHKGRATMAKLRRMYAESYKRWGELTPLGAELHRQIARRMYQRFPSVFADSVWVDAKSTVVIRCILSMEDELLELLRHNPCLRIRHDASDHDMYYMNLHDANLARQRENDEVKRTMKDWEKRHLNSQPLMLRLFTNADYVAKNVDAEQLSNDLFGLAGIVQNSEIRHSLTLYDLFTPDERYLLWQRSNVWWYLHFAGAPQNGGRQPFSQRNLLRNIISEADSCLALSRPGATLRFGHETMVMPLACLLNLNGSYVQVAQVDSLEAHGWIASRIFPMAANIQLVFYKNPKNPKADLLVKALLNEEEATMPLPATSIPYYYRWSDFRKFYLDLLNSYREQ
ncbi:histidine phosphatase family protein [Prevotella intermedia]|uniref:histidine-type phosphatase n=1 Tax=Prevotella intermedia TaxID=28131 RepID=UPI000C24C98A|nr:histidine-type phosphatase [Prevotella intermedia]PJI21780.1 histidine-type phosphatase [Prevotella intermedia]